MMILGLSAFIVSFLSSLFIIYIAHKYRFFIDCHVTHKPQKVHSEPIPRAGGIGIITAMILLLTTPIGWKILLPAILAFGSGIFEDFHNTLSARIRLAMQTIAASVVVIISGSVVTYLGLGITLPYEIGVIFSIFAVVGMINAINIIDGFNGLASGIVLMILFSFAIVSWEHNDMVMLKIIYIVTGSILGFFVLVFPKGKIFLGDGGAYLLGMVIAVIGIYLAGKYKDVSPWYVLAVFAYPVWEVLFSIARKLKKGLSPMKPDNFHMHMLIYRHITKNNSLTAVFILVSLLPFFIYSTNHANCSLCNIKSTAIFVIAYSLLYWFLYRKDQKAEA